LVYLFGLAFLYPVSRLLVLLVLSALVVLLLYSVLALDLTLLLF
jgi:hypothetical protein